MSKVNHLERKRRRIKGSLFGTADMPRVVVSRTNKHIYVQAVDDVTKKTITSVSDIKDKDVKGKTQSAQKVGEQFGNLLKKMSVESIVYDRNVYKYHGRVKALADGIRSVGIKF